MEILELLETLSIIISNLTIIFEIVPITLLWYYFYRTRIVDFLLLSLVFLNSFFNMIAYSLWFTFQDSTTMFMLIFTYILGFFVFGLHAMRIKWKEPPLFFKLFLLWYIISSMIFPFVLGNHTLEFISYLLIECNRISLFLFVIHTYLKTPAMYNDKRTDQSRKLWIFALILEATYPIIGTTASIVFNIVPFTQWDMVMLTDKAIFHYLGFFPMVLGEYLLFYITIKYPEAIIYSKAYLIKILSIYKKIKSETTSISKRNVGINVVLNYIKSIPEEFYQKT
ncbi:MAG: hypothetical protein ACTSW1_13255 [Candidatus Hodarchaeales archaeon]